LILFSFFTPPLMSLSPNVLQVCEARKDLDERKRTAYLVLSGQAKQGAKHRRVPAATVIIY